MRQVSFHGVLAVLCEEYQRDGHEVFEAEGVVFARLVLPEVVGATSLTKVNLTRIADAIVRRAA